ncbi:MAG: caspase domain-containing protein, partial [Nitrospirota bacterium]
TASISAPKGSSSVTLDKKTQEEIRDLRLPRKYALLIGINNYQDPRFTPLHYAESDVERLKAVLEDKKIGNFNEVITLKGREATRNNILINLEIIGGKARKEDIVLIYFSQHGSLEEDKVTGKFQQYLVSYDTRFDSLKTSGLALAKLFEVFNNFKSEKQAMVLTACYSGTGKSILSERIIRELQKRKSGYSFPPIEEISTASVVISSSEWDKPSLEDHELKGDIYTYFFIEALKSKETDTNRDNAITITEAHAMAHKKTYLYSRGQQTPTIHYTIEGTDPINIAGEFKDRGLPTIYSHSERFENVDVFVDGREKGSLPGSIAIAPGRHEIRLREFGENEPFFTGRINIRENDNIEIRDIVNPPVTRQPLPVNSLKRTGFRSGYMDAGDFGWSPWLEIYNNVLDNIWLFNMSWAWDISFRYAEMKEDKITLTSYVISNYWLLNKYLMQERFKIYTGAFLETGINSLESFLANSGKSSIDSRFVPTAGYIIGSSYRTGNISLELTLRYNLLTAAEYRLTNSAFKTEEREYSYDGIAVGFGLSYTFD